MFPYNNNKDFSAVLNALLEAEDVTAADASVSYPPPERPVGKKGENETSRKLTNLIEIMRSRIDRQIQIFEASIADLDKRFGQKMIQLTSTSSGDRSQLADIQSQLDAIRTQYSAKVEEVDGIIEKVQALLPNLEGLPAEQMVIKIGESLKKMKGDLERRATEAQELADNLQSARSQSAQDIEALEQKLYELDDYVQKVEGKLKDATERIEKLETKISRAQNANFDKDVLKDLEKKEAIPQFDHNKPYGDFDFMEHLRRAKANTKKNSSDW